MLSGAGLRGIGRTITDGYELFHYKGFVTVTGNVVKKGYQRRHSSTSPLPILDNITRAKLEKLCQAPGKSEVQLPAISTIDAAIEEACEPTPDQATITDLRSALMSMPSDDRNLWTRMGHCLKTLNDVGRNLWFEWSVTSDKHNPDADSQTWDSFKPTRSGWRGVFSETQRRGWANPACGANRSPQSDLPSANGGALTPTGSG